MCKMLVPGLPVRLDGTWASWGCAIQPCALDQGSTVLSKIDSVARMTNGTSLHPSISCALWVGGSRGRL